MRLWRNRTTNVLINTKQQLRPTTFWMIIFNYICAVTNWYSFSFNAFLLIVDCVVKCKHVNYRIAMQHNQNWKACFIVWSMVRENIAWGEVLNILMKFQTCMISNINSKFLNKQQLLIAFFETSKFKKKSERWKAFWSSFNQSTNMKCEIIGGKFQQTRKWRELKWVLKCFMKVCSDKSWMKKLFFVD